MKFRAAHLFADVDCQRFEQLFFDEAFNEALCADCGLRRALVARDCTDGVLTRAVEIRPQRTLPAPARKLLGTESLGYVEHVRYTFGSYTCHWHIDAAVMPDKVKSFGTIHFVDDGRGGVERVVEGEVQVRVFGLGGTIERLIVADVQKSYNDAAAFTARYLKEHLA